MGEKTQALEQKCFQLQSELTELLRTKGQVLFYVWYYTENACLLVRKVRTPHNIPNAHCMKALLLFQNAQQIIDLNNALQEKDKELTSKNNK